MVDSPEGAKVSSGVASTNCRIPDDQRGEGQNEGIWEKKEFEEHANQKS